MALVELPGDMTQPKLLIVDDCIDTRFLFVSFLSEEGYEVLESSEFDALSLVKSEHPDVILLRDLAIGSTELLNELRKQQISTRVIILSRSGFPLEAAIRYMKLGVCDYWFEPFAVDEMVSSIRQVLTENCTLNRWLIDAPPIVEKLIDQALLLQEELEKFPQRNQQYFDSPYLLTKLREL